MYWARSCGSTGDRIDLGTRACSEDHAQCRTADRGTRLIADSDVLNGTAWLVHGGSSDPQPPCALAGPAGRSPDQGDERQCSQRFFCLGAPDPAPGCPNSGSAGGSSQDCGSGFRSGSVAPQDCGFGLRSDQVAPRWCCENSWCTLVFEASW
jgi:hypothetical protein